MAHPPSPDLLAEIKARAALTDHVDAEANAFAMALLMPADWVRADIAKMGGIDLENAAGVEKLARRYKVSTAVMTIRIGQLIGLFA